MSSATDQNTLAKGAGAAARSQVNSSSSPASAGAETVFAALKSALAAYQGEPGSAELRTQLFQTRRAAAAAIAELPRRKPQADNVAIARDLVREMSASGAHDLEAETEDLALAQAYASQGWSGLLAAMLLVPSWQCPQAPALDAVPDWLWGDYAAWLFVTPQGFCAVGQAEIYAAHVLFRLEELTRWTDRNAGSSAVKAALQAYTRYATNIPLYFSQANLRRHAELRARLLARTSPVRPEAFDRLPEPRDGRKLRIGFVNRHFGSQTETYTTLPTFEHLDPERFEVILFTHRAGGSALENYCREKAKEFYLLPQDVAGQLSILRGAALDVVVFGTNLTAVRNEVVLLALHRVAPLQIVNNSSCITSGFPQVDLYVSGRATEAPDAADYFSERLALLPGPAHAFNYTADQQAPTTAWTRAMLGLPEDALVFCTAANYFKIIPEMQEAWARLLAATPGSRLLVHPFNPNWSSNYPIKRFCSEFDRVLAKHGVSGDRLVVSTARFPSRTDVKALLSVGDVYLDTYPFGGVNSLIDPLELGLPVVAWEGAQFRSRMGTALLRTLGLPELIATDTDSYQAICVRLAQDKAWRDNLRERIAAGMARLPLFLDTLAASDAFGALVERAYDELLLVGHETFRRERTPLTLQEEGDTDATLESAMYLFTSGLEGEAGVQARRVLAANPNCPRARHLLGAALLRQERIEESVKYLLAAIEHAEGNAPLWHDLAIALHRSGREPESFQALKTCVQTDPTRVESWLLLAEWAEASGDQELVREAAQTLERIAPQDPRTLDLQARLKPAS